MIRSERRAAIAPLLLLLAGLCILRAQLLTWAAADAPDGTRYKMSPMALWHVLQPTAIESPTVECGFGWIPSPGLPTCQLAARADEPTRRLSIAAALLLLAGLWAIGTALFLLRPGGRRFHRVAAAFSLGVLALVALALFRPAALELLASIGAMNAGFGGMGWYLVHLVPALAALAAALEWQRPQLVTSSSPLVLGIAAAFACALLFAPRPLGNSLALLSSVCGVAGGLMLVFFGLAEHLVRDRIRPAT